MSGCPAKPKTAPTPVRCDAAELARHPSLEIGNHRGLLHITHQVPF